MRTDHLIKNNYEQCLKCELCTTVCPMMAVNPDYPGPKQAGPDGERYRLKDPAFYDLTLKYCLNCKRCEVACPSNVAVGDIIQAARMRFGRKTKPYRDVLLSNKDLVGSVMTSFVPRSNNLLKGGKFRSALHKVGIDKRTTLPQYTDTTFRKWFSTQSQTGYTRSVAFFHGCHINYNYPKLGKDLVSLLNACAYGVRLLDREKCCGASFIANAFSVSARNNARINLSSIRKALSAGAEAVIACESTCLHTIRDEYEQLLDLRTDDIRSSLSLASKWLYSKLESGEIKLAFKEDWRASLVYHISCHMSVLGWTAYSVGLLKMIPGLKLLVLEQECCGLAGSFGFKTENFDYSQKIGEKLFAKINTSGAEGVVCDCQTCKYQIEMNTPYKVYNPIEILFDALDIEKTKELNQL